MCEESNKSKDKEKIVSRRLQRFQILELSNSDYFFLNSAYFDFGNRT